MLKEKEDLKSGEPDTSRYPLWLNGELKWFSKAMVPVWKIRELLKAPTERIFYRTDSGSDYVYELDKAIALCKADVNSVMYYEQSSIKQVMSASWIDSLYNRGIMETETDTISQPKDASELEALGIRWNNE